MRRTIHDETHDQFRATVRTFLHREVVPHFERWEQDGIVDRDLYRKAGELGIMGLPIPEEHGGGGTSDVTYQAIVQEEFASSGVFNAGQGLVNHGSVVVPYVLAHADEAQRHRWLPGMASGDLLGAIAMTEPSTGSDLSMISTRARLDGDEYVLNGSKMFITSAMLCDFAVVACRTGDSEKAHHNLSLLVVEADMPGFTRGRNLDKIGQHSADTGELFFSDVRVPAANLLGEPGAGFSYLMRSLPAERLLLSVAAVAHATWAFELTLAYTKERRAFGQAVASFQNSRFALATMRTELDIAQVFVDRQVEAFNAGELTAEDAAEAKWWTTDLNRRVLDQCLQLHGGYGYMEEYPIARAWRDGRVMSIYGGTNEIMKEIIGKRTLGV